MDDRADAAGSATPDLGGVPAAALTAYRERITAASAHLPDEPSLRFVRRLVDEAERTDEDTIRQRLLDRADVRLEFLEELPAVTVNRDPAAVPRPREELARRARTRALTQARRRGVRLPDHAQGALETSEALYRRRVDEVRVSAAIEEASRAVPEAAGRYHAGAVAADTLAALRRYRGGYLAAQLARIEAYGVLAAFVESVVPPAETAKRRSR